MSINFVTGKPGGGKGIVSLKKLIDELMNGDRPIITNLPVRIHPWVRVSKRRGKMHYKPELGLKAYLIREYGQDFDCEKRVFLLTDEQVPEFYLYRVIDHKLVQMPHTRNDKGSVCEYETDQALKAGGVVYCTDESWKFFGSRDWQKTSSGVLYYAAQHRHFGDTWIVTTQHTKQIETALRQVAQDFAVVTNHSKLKVGIFRQPDVFSVAIYTDAPMGSAQQPMERQIFTLDKAGLGSCYDTAAGVGLAAGGGADTHERKKGLPWWLIIVAIGVFGFLVWKACNGAGWLVGWTLKGKNEPSQTVSKSVTKAKPVGPAVAVPLDKNSTNSVKAEISPGLPVTVTAIDALLGYWRVGLSDGRVFTERDSSLEMITSTHVVIAGQTYMKSAPAFIIEEKTERPYHVTPLQIRPESVEEYEDTQNPRKRYKVIPGENWQRMNSEAK